MITLLKCEQVMERLELHNKTVSADQFTSMELFWQHKTNGSNHVSSCHH